MNENENGHINEAESKNANSNENADFSKAFDMLGEMLGSEDGQKQISDIISMLTGGGGESPPPAEQKSSFKKGVSENTGISSADFDMLKAAKKLMGASKGKKDKNTAFLEALKPFLHKERQKKLDSAVKLISAAALFKEFGGFFKGGD